MKRFLLTAALALPHLLPLARTPSGISLDRDQLRVGDTVTVVVNFEDATRWCGLRVNLGDGDVRDLKVEDFPVTLTKRYASAGRYVIRAEGRFVPRGLLSVLPCTGRDRTATLEVASAQRNRPLPPRQVSSQDNGVVKSPPPRQRNVTDVEREETRKKERERQTRAEEHGHEQRQRERQQKDEREAEKRDWAEQREQARRAGEAVRRPPSREAATTVPVPAQPRAPIPASAPAPAASKPRDSSLKVF